jgi:hypothetical protein
VPNGTDTCVKAGTASGECGAGIPKGTPLKFNRAVLDGVATTTEEVTAEKASWATEGINVTSAGLLRHGHRQRRLLPERVLVGDAELGWRVDLRPRLLPVR